MVVISQLKVHTISCAPSPGASSVARRVDRFFNGYKCHINLVVADLGALNVIIGMDFLKAYGVVIVSNADQVSLGS